MLLRAGMVFAAPGHGVFGGAVGGGLLGSIGDPAGLLAWAVGGSVVGGVAGKYLGRPFSKGDLEEIGETMQPDTSAFLLRVEDWTGEAVIDKMKGFNANVVTPTVGDELSGEIAQVVAAEGSLSAPKDQKDSADKGGTK